jgi:Ca2+/Na+ antiporter
MKKSAGQINELIGLVLIAMGCGLFVVGMDGIGAILGILTGLIGLLWFAFGRILRSQG